ncbi:leucine-rich repeat protein [Alistipes shahii]|uniref:leucine-rich repeat protein n=1 Tax=Alistipes shahii TaxID=328814 RepID=UPI001459E5C1|nr:leucine-rich repeat protein [Alistipes shahii]MDY4930719.1 leucine-rich repeat protein [Alistipes shahii]NMF24493.1 leucine-rich repeat protein [Alistipes shahii]
MKRHLIFTGLLGLSLTGCVKDLDTPTVGEGDTTLPIQLYNEISQIPTTRVNDEGFCNGDGVGVYVVNYENGTAGTLRLEGNQADNVRYVYDEPNGKWTPDEAVYFRDKHTHVDLIGYYPYSTPTSVEAYPFEVAKDQSTDAANGLLGGYEASDFLWGKTVDVAPTTQRINIKFQHRMAGALVSLSEGTGFAEGEFAQLEKAVLVTNTIRKATIDLATGEITPSGDVPTTGIVPYKKGGEFRAVVVPQTVAASTPLFSITVDGTPYVFRKTEPFAYTGGKLHKFTIEISKKSESGLEFKLLGESITAWETDNISHDATAREYIIIDCPEAGTLKECIAAAGKDYTKVKNLKVTGTIDARDFYMMRDEMTALQSINLKEVEIAAYRGIDSNYVSFNANEIPDNVFANKSTLIRFVFPENITKIGGSAFSQTNLSGSLVIPNGVTEIGTWAFSNCPFGGTLTLPRSLKIIRDNAFSGIDCIGPLDIPNTVTHIYASAFGGCSGFTGQLKLPDGLHFLGPCAFEGCSGFTGSLTIPSQIKRIETSCFNNCSGLNGTLSLPKGLTEIENYAFARCSFRGTLNLPENLLIIGLGAFGYNQFSGELKLPQSLPVIKDRAFEDNPRLTGIVEFPEEIVSIAPGVFLNCSQLQGVVIPKNVEAIREGAFENCFQLNSITCKAQNPPQLSATAFAGVAKDNFTVEVPEEAVASYSTAPEWKEFRRFAAHRDFSISRNLFRALNASHSKTLVMRAPSGEAWSVESKPDWVTVEPMNGVGKVEVTVTVAEQPKGAGNRTGEVVFLLDGKDYRSRTTIEQYDYQYGDGDVLTAQRATKGAGVDLVFMGDCFDAKDIAEGKYLDAMNEAIGYFFAVEPYKTYRDYFNVYTIFGLSPDSGVGDVNTIREAKFGSAYALGGITPDESVCFEYACKAPTVTQDKIGRTLVTLIENTEDYGGITYMWGDGSAIACCPMSRDVYPYDFRGLVQHEAGGHGFGKLGDEYIYHNAFIQTCPCLCCPHVKEFNDNKSRGWFENLSLTGNMYDVPWSHFIFDPQYSNLVDIYEGGYMHMRGVFRSEPNSCMNNNVPYFSAISREAIVKRMKEYAGESYSFEEFKAHDVLDASTAGAETRSMSSALEFAASNKQQNPVYMGDKPKFNKSK